MSGAFDGLTSGLADHIRSLLELKHALGFPYDTSQRHLRRFDQMCARDYSGQAALTRPMAMGWAVARPGEHVNAQARRITPIPSSGSRARSSAGPPCAHSGSRSSRR